MSLATVSLAIAIDMRALTDAGYPASSIGPSILIPPIYLAQRSTLVGKGQAPLAIWLLCVVPALGTIAHRLVFPIHFF